MSEPLQLYSYWRSSAAYRVRIGLNLKGLAYDIVPVHLLHDGGQQHSAEYRGINPQQLVPVLGHGHRRLSQSLAILEYLDEMWPTPALLPSTARERQRVRALALLVACDIHPLNNLRVLQYLAREFGADDSRREAWCRHWVDLGLGAVERMLREDPRTGRFCHGETPTLADCCLVPQVFNARRVGARLDDKPTILRIVSACEALEAFRRAAPANQPDAE